MKGNLSTLLRQVGGRAPLASWRLTVEGAEQITPLMRRIHLVGDNLTDMRWAPGQDLVLNLPDAPRRHYTIRALRDGRLSIDFVLHGHGPAASWAANARPGDVLEAAGPRGRTRLAEGVDWHLFVGDETCIPAIRAMVESLPRGAAAWALLEVQSEEETQGISSPADLRVEWIVRGGPARPNDLLLSRLRVFERPAGVGHAYILGETSGVRAERQWLIAEGWPRERITAEGYWRPGRSGGHDHI